MRPGEGQFPPPKAELWGGAGEKWSGGVDTVALALRGTQIPPCSPPWVFAVWKSAGCFGKLLKGQVANELHCGHPEAPLL